MSEPRLVLITRRYWPLVGGAEMVMARLARAFRDRGVTATVLTAQWQPQWPREVDHAGVRVVRLPQSPLRVKGTWQYMRGIARWLRQHRKEFDGVLVSMLKHSAYAAVGEGRRGRFPVVLRAEGGGATGDIQFQEQARLGQRIRRRCQQADLIVAPAHSIEQELLRARYARNRVATIPNGVPIPPSLVDRNTARRHLAGIHSDLALDEQARLILYTGRLDAAKGLLDLVRAWSKVVAAIPTANLWLIGEGPLRDDLFQLVKDLELRSSVRLPGTFDDVSELLRAADAFVLPSYAEGLSLSLLEAMAHAVPVIASDIAGNREVIRSSAEGVLVPPGDVAGWARAMTELLRDAARAKQLADAGRARAEADYSLERMADRHLEAIDRLLRACSTSRLSS